MVNRSSNLPPFEDATFGFCGACVKFPEQRIRRLEKMPKRTSKTGSELFIVDNSDEDWKVLRYLHDWCQLSKAIDVATGYFEIGGLLALKDEWQRVDDIRVLMGDEVSQRTKAAFNKALERVKFRLDDSLEKEKLQNDFLTGVPAIVEGIRSGKIRCRVYRKDKFHAKAYITHARQEVIGSFAPVGSSNLTYPGITENIELNVQISGPPVRVLQEWYEQHWDEAEDVTEEMLRVIERHIREYSPFEVYVRALHEFCRGHQLTANEWEKADPANGGSRMYDVLDFYQQEGYHALMQIGVKTSGDFGLPDGLTPEDIFRYAYAVLHSPGYRSRYAEFLKIDFPRLPLTGNLELFRSPASAANSLPCTCWNRPSWPTRSPSASAVRTRRWKKSRGRGPRCGLTRPRPQASAACPSRCGNSRSADIKSVTSGSRTAKDGCCRRTTSSTTRRSSSLCPRRSA